MALFTNYATLSYNGGITNSNTVTGEILETMTAAKAAVMDDYTARDDVTYVITLINSGTAPINNVVINDDLGGYEFGGTTVYPLNYVEGSVRYYVNGVLQPALTVSAGPPMTISGINLPAGANAAVIYEAVVTNFAPLAAGSEITNTAVISSVEKALPITVSETIGTEDRAELFISKAISPAVISAGGELTYTFVIQNVGNTPAAVGDDVVLRDIFDPRLTGISVTFDGQPWTQGVNYDYDPATGEFETGTGQITVPAAQYTQLPSGEWVVTPGTATVTVSGNVITDAAATAAP